MENFEPIYLYSEYLRPLSIQKDSIQFVNINTLTKEELEKVSKLYMSLFNSDNKNLIAQLGIKGRTVLEGLWLEPAYTVERIGHVIATFLHENSYGIVAFGKTLDGKKALLGSSVWEKRNVEQMESKDYLPPFSFSEKADVWCEIDTFRRDLLDEHGVAIKGLASKMRKQITESVKRSGVPLLIYSSTSNPQMVRSWQKDGWTILEKETTFGNKFQAFKYL
jgi:hypothetical protein